MSQKTSWKYFWYWLSTLFPIIGLVIGIVFLRKGIILKNRILKGIGIFGILFTLAFCFGIIIYSKYSEVGKRKREEIAVMMLNRVMQDMEYYKVQFGSYPDSLEQLKLVDNMVFIMDPLSQKGLFSTKLEELQYKKIDSSHYTIFSSGLDQIPNTTDDVYPTIYYWLKTGLVKHSK